MPSSDTPPAEPPAWRLDDDTWTALCDALESGSAVDRPYERIAVSGGEDTHLEGYVEEPYPSMEDDDYPALGDADDVDWETVPENEIQTLPEAVHDPLWDAINALSRQAISEVDSDAADTADSERPDLPVEFLRYVVTPTKAGGAFCVVRTLDADEHGLYTQFRELMVTLGHAEDPDDIAYGRSLAPYDAPHSDNEIDLGMSATAFKYVENPHEVWSDLDTLEEYIDRLVENGGDRETLEAQDEYLQHFHPNTTIQTLDDEQAAALRDWKAALEDMIVPYVSFGDVVRNWRLSDATFDEDGNAVVALSVTAGDDIERT